MGRRRRPAERVGPEPQPEPRSERCDRCTHGAACQQYEACMKGGEFGYYTPDTPAVALVWLALLCLLAFASTVRQLVSINTMVWLGLAVLCSLLALVWHEAGHRVYRAKRKPTGVDSTDGPR